MKTGKKHIILYVVLLLLVLVSCSDRRTVIGVSQCSDDIWRQKVNREIKIGQYQYKNVDVVLKQTDKTISEVAAEVGFAIPGYFSACFKKQFGINPTELRD